jgi:hypothetical protein
MMGKAVILLTAVEDAAGPISREVYRTYKQSSKIEITVQIAIDNTAIPMSISIWSAQSYLYLTRQNLLHLAPF